MGALRSTLDYFGLSEPNADELEYYREEEEAEMSSEAPSYPSSTSQKAKPLASPTVSSKTKLSALPKRETSNVAKFPQPTTPSADRRRIVTVTPTSYNQAKEIGEAFRDGTPVIMNLSLVKDQEAKRMVDFAAGLVFGLSGSIEKIDGRVFLLTPSTVEVAQVKSRTSKSELFD